MVPASSTRVSRVPVYSGSRRVLPFLRLRGFHPLRQAFPEPFRWNVRPLPRSVPRNALHSGLPSFHFARRYSGNRCFFPFLALLGCFGSGGSPPCVMDSRTDGRVFPGRVSPFRHPRISDHLHLPAAFRSLSRLSSAPGARASALCSFLLNRPAAIALAAFLSFFFLPLLDFSVCLMSFQESDIFLSDRSRFSLLHLYEVFKVQPRPPLFCRPPQHPHHCSPRILRPPVKRTPSLFFLFCSGSHLLSRAVAGTVSSAVRGLTFVFGMCTGVSPGRIATRKCLQSLTEGTAASAWQMLLPASSQRLRH